MPPIEFSRRELIASPLRYLKKPEPALVSGAVSFPPPPSYEGLPTYLLPSLAIVSKAAELRLTRREILGVVAGGLSVSSVSRFSRAEASRYKIVPVEHYERTNGAESFPWNPLDERNGGIVNTGRNIGGAFDKYDELDRIINGEWARSSYWIPTREWHAQIAQAVVDETNWVQAGFCLYAAAASIFSPKIEGEITVLGITLNEFERRQIATMYFGGMLRDPFYAEVTPDVVGYVRDVLFPQGVPIVINYFPTADQDWWAALSGISGADDFLLTRPMDYRTGNSVLNRQYYNAYTLRQMVVLNPGFPQPGEEGAFVFIDEKVGGLIIGTHQLAS